MTSPRACRTWVIDNFVGMIERIAIDPGHCDERPTGSSGTRDSFRRPRLPHRKTLPRPPRLRFPHRIAVFVDGCFWHGCPIHATQPKQNAEFWRQKIARNQARDLLVTRQLRARGWRVLRLWEHELTRKDERRLLARLRRVGLLAASTV